VIGARQHRLDPVLEGSGDDPFVVGGDDDAIRTALLREALGNDEHSLPSVTRTCWTIGLIAAAIGAIALGGIGLPDQPEVAYTPLPYRDAIANPATARWPAPRVDDSAISTQYGNVVDLTF
jgi:hypothetical protein